ncbi:glycosyltransferase 87 family protein, partial [Roseomonas rosulenta]|uniref:glycosyltransferase 87 family protein n=1 Tax=Roseomonas rosulenta TaxID=2748667 RepID=UPI001E290B47
AVTAPPALPGGMTAGAATAPAPRRGLALAALLLLAAGTGLASALLGADRSWDAQNYHVYVPWSVLVPRPNDLLPAGLQGFHNPLADLPFALMLRWLNYHPRLVAFLMGVPAGVVLWILWLCAQAVLAEQPRRGVLALLALAGAAGGAAFRGQLGTTSGDVVTGGFVLLGLLAVLGPDGARWGGRALLAGLAVGAAIGLKLTNAPFALALAALLVARIGADRRLPGALLACALGGVVGMALAGGWWAQRMFAETGNPIFPYFHQLFDASEGAPRAGRDLQFMPAGLPDALARPFLWAIDDTPRVTEERMRDPRIALGLLAALVLLGRARARPLAVFFLVAYAVWLPVFSIYRYIAVLELLAPVLIVAALAMLPQRIAIAAAAAFAVLAFPLTKPVPSLRGALGARYLDVRWPGMAPGAAILGTEKPTGFLAVGLPPLTPFGSLLGLAEVGGPQDRARLAALLAGEAPLYAVAPGEGRGLDMLAPYGLAPEVAACRRICTNWSPAGVGPLVCPLTRTARTDPAPPLRHAGPARELCEAAGPGFASAGRR